MLTLRPYQEKALSDLFEYFEEGKGTRPLVILPTGAGKSLVIASFVDRVLKESPHVRIMVCVHSRELVQQNHDELKANAPHIKTGIYSAGLQSRNLTAQVIFAGIQSVYNKVYKFPKIDIVIIDEAHSIPRSADTRYGRFLKDMAIANPDFCLWGTTATPFRTESGLLTEGDKKIFDGIAHVTEISTLIEEGYLVPIISKGGIKNIDLSDVHVRAGEYAQNELAHAADDPELVRLAVKEFVEYGKDRKAWLVYCCGVDHAYHVCAEIKKHGVDCKVVTGDTPLDKRDQILNDFKKGKLRCICNVMVLSTGFNAKNVDMIVLLFSTLSAGKYIQVVGRGTRTFPGKKDTLLMDYGGNVLKFGVIDAIEITKKNNIFNCKPLPPPMKECPSCKVIFHARIMKCPSCGYEFEIPEATAAHGTEAYSGPVLTSQQTPYLMNVKDMYCTRHHKPGKTDSLKMSFYDNMEKEVPLWICLNHTGFAKEKAEAMVKQMGGTAKTVEDALKEWHTWRKPAKIVVKPEGKWLRVTGFQFPKGESQQQRLSDT
jgi:DNA repair protein RadD